MDKEQMILQRLEELRREQLKALKELKKVEKAKKKRRRRTTHGLPVNHGGSDAKPSVPYTTKTVTPKQSDLHDGEKSTDKTRASYKNAQKISPTDGGFSTTPCSLNKNTSIKLTTPHSESVATTRQAWSAPQFENSNNHQSSTQQKYKSDKSRLYLPNKKGDIFVTPKSTRTAFKKYRSSVMNKPRRVSAEMGSSSKTILKDSSISRKELLTKEDSLTPTTGFSPDAEGTKSMSCLASKVTSETKNTKEDDDGYKLETAISNNQENVISQTEIKSPQLNLDSIQGNLSCQKSHKDPSTITEVDFNKIKSTTSANKSGKVDVNSAKQTSEEFDMTVKPKAENTLNSPCDSHKEQNIDKEIRNPLRSDQITSDKCTRDASVHTTVSSSSATLKSSKCSSVSNQPKSRYKRKLKCNVVSPTISDTTGHISSDCVNTSSAVECNKQTASEEDLNLETNSQNQSDKNATANNSFDQKTHIETSQLCVMRSRSKRNRQRKSNSCSEFKYNSLPVNAGNESSQLSTQAENSHGLICSSSQSSNKSERSLESGHRAESVSLKSSQKAKYAPNEVGFERSVGEAVSQQSNSDNTSPTSQSMLSGYSLRTQKLNLGDIPRAHHDNATQMTNSNADQPPSPCGMHHGCSQNSSSAITTNYAVNGVTNASDNPSGATVNHKISPKSSMQEPESGISRNFTTCKKPIQPCNEFTQCLFSDELESDQESQEFPLLVHSKYHDTQYACGNSPEGIFDMKLNNQCGTTTGNVVTTDANMVVISDMKNDGVGDSSGNNRDGEQDKADGEFLRSDGGIVKDINTVQAYSGCHNLGQPAILGGHTDGELQIRNSGGENTNNVSGDGDFVTGMELHIPDGDTTVCSIDGDFLGDNGDNDGEDNNVVSVGDFDTGQSHISNDGDILSYGSGHHIVGGSRKPTVGKPVVDGSDNGTETYIIPHDNNNPHGDTHFNVGGSTKPMVGENDSCSKPHIPNSESVSHDGTHCIVGDSNEPMAGGNDSGGKPHDGHILSPAGGHVDVSDKCVVGENGSNGQTENSNGKILSHGDNVDGSNKAVLNENDSNNKRCVSSGGILFPRDGQNMVNCNKPTDGENARNYQKNVDDGGTHGERHFLVDGSNECTTGENDQDGHISLNDEKFCDGDNTDIDHHGGDMSGGELTVTNTDVTMTPSTEKCDQIPEGLTTTELYQYNDHTIDLPSPNENLGATLSKNQPPFTNTYEQSSSQKPVLENVSEVTLEHIDVLCQSSNKVCAIKYHDVKLGDSTVKLLVVCLQNLLMLWKCVSLTNWLVLQKWKLKEEEMFSDIEVTSADSCVVIFCGGNFSKALGRVYCAFDRGNVCFDLFEEISFSSISTGAEGFQGLCLLPSCDINYENLYVVLASSSDEMLTLTKWTIDLLCFCAGDSMHFTHIPGSNMSSLVPVQGSGYILGCVNFDINLWDYQNGSLLSKIPFTDTLYTPLCIYARKSVAMLFLVLLYKEEKFGKLVAVNPLNCCVSCLKTLNFGECLQNQSDEILHCTQSGAYIISSFTKGQLLIWNMSADKPKLLKPIKDDISCISLHDKHLSIAFGTKRGNVHVLTYPQLYI